ncbi:MAG: HNH nuclease family protein [Betaproteobacteria bacterium]|nr:HNH nuclease family protein [Betaproteobacteria bacterium]
MSQKKSFEVGGNRSPIVAEAHRQQALREQTYREQALKLYPWVCGRCAREFGGKTLRELTVHHKDHNHDNNPADGSNWELLCLYCHDNEHARQQVADAYGTTARGGQPELPSTYKPFAALQDLLKRRT